MKTYKITYTETIVYEFYVDAENEKDADEKFKQGLYEGEFDFTRGDVDISDYTIEEEE